MSHCSLSPFSSEFEKTLERMSAAENEAHIKQLLHQIEKLGVSEPQKVLSCAERLLAIAPTHAVALHCKGVAQLQIGKPELAKVTLIKALELYRQSAAQNQNASELLFHIACVDYRRGAYAEALTRLTEIPVAERTLGTRHLLAQCYYNTEDFASCAAIYKAMLQADEFRDEQDRQEVVINLTAAYAGYEAAQVEAIVQEAEEKSCDLLYNAATAKIELKDYAAANVLLKAAEDAARRDHGLPQQAADADLDNKAFFNDTAGIMVQRAFIHYVSGEESEAEKILQKVLDRKPSSISTYAVACVNWAALKRHRDFFDTHRRLKHAQSPQVQVKLTSKQRLFVLYNTSLLLLHSGKLQQCKSTVDRILKDNPESPLGPLAMTALLLKEKGAGKADAYLKNFLQEQQKAGSTDGSHAQLLVAQLWLEQGNLAVALKHLAEVSSLIGSSPAAIATLANRYAKTGDMDAARTLLRTAIASKKVEGAANFAAAFFLQHGLYNEAAEAYQVLLKSGKKEDPALYAGLAASLTASDPAEAYSIATSKLLTSSELSSATELSRSADLEKQPLPRNLLEEKGYKRKSEANADANAVAAEKRRVRKMRRPPVVTPTGPPDPERWVPMSMRPSIKDLPPRRVREMKRLRATEQELKRKQHSKKLQAQREAANTPAS